MGPRICTLPRPPRRLISACSTTLHNADYIHELAPHAIEDWVNYHRLLGIEHFTIFDTDGSFAPYVRDLVDAGLVTYRPRWPSLLAPKFGLLASGVERSQQRPLIVEPHALDDCMWGNRHISDWVMLLHSFEEYLHSPTLAAGSAPERSSNDAVPWKLTSMLKEIS